MFTYICDVIKFTLNKGTAMKKYYTTSADIVKDVMTLNQLGVIAWAHECFMIAQKQDNPSIANFAREVAHLWCEVNSGEQVEIVQI